MRPTDLDPVYRKTALGLDEMRERRLGLPRKLFSLLLAIDGQRSREQLCSSLSAFGDVGAQLDELLERQLIEDPNAWSTTSTAPVTEPAPLPEPVAPATTTLSMSLFAVPQVTTGAAQASPPADLTLKPVDNIAAAVARAITPPHPPQGNSPETRQLASRPPELSGAKPSPVARPGAAPVSDAGNDLVAATVASQAGQVTTRPAPAPRSKKTNIALNKRPVAAAKTAPRVAPRAAPVAPSIVGPEPVPLPELPPASMPARASTAPVEPPVIDVDDDWILIDINAYEVPPTDKTGLVDAQRMMQQALTPFVGLKSLDLRVAVEQCHHTSELHALMPEYARLLAQQMDREELRAHIVSLLGVIGTPRQTNTA